MPILTSESEDNRALALFETTIKNSVTKEVEEALLELIKPKMREIAIKAVQDWDIRFRVEGVAGFNYERLTSIIFTEHVINKTELISEIKVMDR